MVTGLARYTFVILHYAIDYHVDPSVLWFLRSLPSLRANFATDPLHTWSTEMGQHSGTSCVGFFCVIHSTLLKNIHLVGGLEHFLFSHIGLIIPFDSYFSNHQPEKYPQKLVGYTRKPSQVVFRCGIWGRTLAPGGWLNGDPWDRWMKNGWKRIQEGLDDRKISSKS